MAILEFRGEYRWLSNFAPSTVVYGGVKYPTVEHAYQAAKTVNAEERWKIQECKTPGKAKRVGKTVTLRSTWLIQRHFVMKELLLQKFGSNPYRDLLLDTGDEELIEGNNWGDTYWGVCNGVGENYLGVTIMNIRNYIFAELERGSLSRGS